MQPRVRFELSPQQLTVILSGELKIYGTGRVWTEVKRFLEHNTSDIEVRAFEVTQIDSAGVAMLVYMQRVQNERQKSFVITGLSDAYEKLFHLFDRAELEQSWEDDQIYWHIDEIGRRTMTIWEKIRDLIAFSGEGALAFMKSLAQPHKVRWRDVFRVIEEGGVHAIPIVMMIGFLLGLILAFQSAIPMRRFGAEIFVANLIGLSIIRELGPLMTAVVLAGRSGSAFAAEIGTMQINEEVDALKTMGFDPMHFLVMPRVFAVLFLSPLLTMFFHVAGLAGGAVVMLSLGFPLVTYIRQIQSAATYGDLVTGLFKATVFGVLVASIGCYRGLQTLTGASAVGKSTTSAVVSGIVLIAVFDGIFSVIFYFIGL